MEILDSLSRNKSLSSDELAILRLGLNGSGAECSSSHYLRHRDLEFAQLFSKDLLLLRSVYSDANSDPEKLSNEQWLSIDLLMRIVRPAPGFEKNEMIRLADLAEELSVEKTKNGFLRQILAVKN